MKFRIYL